MTQHDRIVAALERRGWKVDLNARTERYTQLSHVENDYHYYVGRAGACRRGKIIATSVPISAATKRRLIEEGGK